MSRYIVFEPAAAESPSERARFVRDGFAGWAVLFPFLWLLRHGVIVTGLLVAALWLACAALAEIPGLSLAASLLPLLLGLLVALEGPSLRAARLRRKGFREAAVVTASGETEASILYYAAATNSPEENDVVRERALSPRAPMTGRGASLLDPPRMTT